MFFLLLQKDLRPQSKLRHLGQSNENKAKSEGKSRGRREGITSMENSGEVASAPEHRLRSELPSSPGKQGNGIIPIVQFQEWENTCLVLL